MSWKMNDNQVTGRQGGNIGTVRCQWPGALAFIKKKVLNLIVEGSREG